MFEMTRYSANSVNCATAFCCTILLLFLASPALCDENATALMLEVSPVEGGYLNIVPGVHNFDIYSEVTLKATPKPGYQFVCWLGNVTNASSGSTSVMLDSPKIVIAVFERSKFDVLAENDYIDTGGGGGGLVRSAGLSDSSLEQAVSATNPPGSHHQHIPHNPPVPPDNGETEPPAVPEPATITLFLSGFFILANRRNRGANLMNET
jgi:hypothetical protein